MLYTDTALDMATEMLRARRCGPAHYNLVSAGRHLGALIERVKDVSVLFKDEERKARQSIAMSCGKGGSGR